MTVWKARAASGPIALIAGQGEFPVIFAKAAMSVGRPVMVFGVTDHTDKRVEAFASESHYVGLGELGRLVELLRQKKIKQSVFAGSVPKKKIYDPSFRLDADAQNFMSKARNKGDDHLLRAFELFLRTRCGIAVIDPRVLLKETLAAKGVLTRRRPTEQEWRDLKLGFQVAKHTGKMDIGQTVVIKDGVVLAVEAIEGTDQAIRRGGELGRGEVVVVKASKPNQDLRFDLPCVGPETLEAMRSVSSRALGVEAGKTILISKEKLLETADGQNMTIAAF